MRPINEPISRVEKVFDIGNLETQVIKYVF